MRTKGSGSIAGFELFSRGLYEYTSKHALLDKISILYVFAPVVIWVFGWLRIYYAVPLVAIITWGAYRSIPRPALRLADDGAETTEPRTFSPWFYRHVALVLFAICTVVTTGWGVGLKNVDYFKHEVFLHDLMDFAWPVAYENMGQDGRPGMLTAYLSFYLVPAALGKLTASWSIAWYVAGAWIVLGTYLTFCWIARCMGETLLWVAFFFMFFGGLDILGWLLVPNHFLRGDLLVEWWHLRVQAVVARGGATPVLWAYGDNLITQAWAPHHILPGWIVLFMILRDSLRARTSYRSLFLASAVPLSSFFCAVGLLPFVLTAVVLSRRTSVFTSQNILAGPLIVGFSALYMASNRGEFPIGPLWEYQNLNTSWLMLLVFYAIAFGIYWSICWIGRLRPASRELRIFGRVAVAILLVLPWCVFGTFSELVVKGAIPALAVLILYFASAIRDSATDQDSLRSRRLLMAALTVGFLGAISHLQYSFQGNGGLTTPVPDVSKVERLHKGNPWVVQQTRTQLMSDGETIFWRHLARPAVIQK